MKSFRFHFVAYRSHIGKKYPAGFINDYDSRRIQVKRGQVCE